MADDLPYDDPRPSDEPLGSLELAVAKDNLITLDAMVNSEEDELTNRKGKKRDTLRGHRKAVNAAIRASTSQYIGEYAAGITFEHHNEYVTSGASSYKPKDTIDLPITTDLTSYPLVTDDPRLTLFSSDTQTYSFTSIENMKSGLTSSGFFINESMIGDGLLVFTRQYKKEFDNGGDRYLIVPYYKFEGLMGSGETPDNHFSHYMFSGADYVAISMSDTVTIQKGNYEQHTPGLAESGDNIYSLFEFARKTKRPIYLNASGNYRLSTDVVIWDGIDVSGDFSTSIYTDFSSSGRVAIRSSLSETYQSVILSGFIINRRGRNAEHGILIDAIDTLKLDVIVLSDGNALGGGCSVSSIHPYKRKCNNVDIKCRVEYGGNYGLQLGYIGSGNVILNAKNTQRESLGLEPVALNIIDFTGDMISSDDIITINNHGMDTGHPIIYSSENQTVPSSLTHGDYYFVIKESDNTIKLANSKRNALDNVPLSGLYGNISGTQKIIECSVMSNVDITCNSESFDVASAGSSTGNVIVTSSSGGYFENVNLSARVSEKNNESGTSAIAIYGAKGISINSPAISSAKTSGMYIDSATLNNLPYQNASGGTSYYTPSPAINMNPDLLCNNAQISDCKSYGINCKKGRVIISGGKYASDYASNAAVIISNDAYNDGTKVRDFISDAPNVVKAFDGVGFQNCINAVTGKKTGSVFQRFNEGMESKAATGSGSYSLLSLTDGSGSIQSYSGVIKVMARADDLVNTLRATYDLVVNKYGGQSGGSVGVSGSAGLTTGGNTTHPSFTFSIDANDNLIATPVGSTSGTRTFYFDFIYSGDINTATP